MICVRMMLSHVWIRKSSVLLSSELLLRRDLGAGVIAPSVSHNFTHSHGVISGGDQRSVQHVQQIHAVMNTAASNADSKKTDKDNTQNISKWQPNCCDVMSRVDDFVAELWLISTDKQMALFK